ncbi:rhomboid family intramembrane serine protease [Sorangium sp. So ce1097]|uniref:rhomboid family intramembrane serine protease n=1 Tax=Sorangium sp. So ce1097 TaxID=3133330 RepID=UPI003F5E1077
MERGPGDEAADRHDRLLAALYGRGELVLLRSDAGLSELAGRAAPLRVVLVTVADDASAEQIRARIEPLVKAVRAGGPPTHFVLVGGGAAAGRAALSGAAPFVQLVRMGFHHVDAAGALARVKGPALPALDEASARLAGVGPLGPEALAGAIEEGRALAQQERAIVDRLTGSRRVTAVIVVACAALLAVSYAFGPGTHEMALWRMGANSGEAVRRGEVYRLLASAFLHADAVHLFVNMLALWSFGPMLEALFGPRRYLLLYGASALGGSLASNLLDDRWSVGASGAIWGLMAAGIGVALRPHGLLPPAMIAQMRSRAWWPLAINLVYSFQPGVDLLAHLGGGVVGFALVVTVLPRGLTPVEQRARRERLTDAEPTPRPLLSAAAALVAAAMALSVVVALAAGRPWELAAPPALTRTAVGDTGVALDLPQAAVDAAAVEDLEGVRFYTYGRLPETTIMFQLAVFPLDGEVPPDQLDGLLEQERRTLDERRPAGAVAKGPATRVTLGGRPAVSVRNELPNGVQVVSTIVVLGDKEVVLQAYSTKDRPASWAGIEDKVAASLGSP